MEVKLNEMTQSEEEMSLQSVTLVANVENEISQRSRNKMDSQHGGGSTRKP